jgi:hypothetical protein
VWQQQLHEVFGRRIEAVPTQNSKSQINPAFSPAFRVLSRDRFEKYAELSDNWVEDKNIQTIIKLLDDDPKHTLRTLSFDKKEAFVGFYEEIALMLYSGLLKKQIAFYMFGYYTIRCDESADFWRTLDKNKYYWSLFRRLANDMQKIEQDILAGRENPDTWEFEF